MTTPLTKKEAELRPKRPSTTSTHSIQLGGLCVVPPLRGGQVGLRMLQFFFDKLAKNAFAFQDPVGQRLAYDLPSLVIFLHAEHDAVAAVIDYIDCKNAFL